MRVLPDTDVLLDFDLNREPFAEGSEALLTANDQGRFEGYISAITPVNLYYIARKLKGATLARELVREVLVSLQVCPITVPVLLAALNHPMKDFEDAVQNASASAHGVDAIITRNLKDYALATLPVYSPADSSST